MTEEEAKTKWCPLAQIAVMEPCPHIQTCAGSNCMMWRLEKDLYRDDYVGYCGLAGKP